MNSSILLERNQYRINIHQDDQLSI